MPSSSSRDATARVAAVFRWKTGALATSKALVMFLLSRQSARAAALVTGGMRRSHRARATTSLFSTVAKPETNTGNEYKVNLLTLPLPELEILVKSVSGLGCACRARLHSRVNRSNVHANRKRTVELPRLQSTPDQQLDFQAGGFRFDDMADLPLKLRTLLRERATVGSLHLEVEQISKDGTKKRAYKLHDGQMIESVLMPYTDGRRTACISSQAGW